MGTGALVDQDLIPADVRNSNDPKASGGWNDIFVRLRPGVDGGTARRSLARIVSAINKGSDAQVLMRGVLRPAEIVNYRSMGSTPALLGAALSAATVLALALTFVASVRRRRRELAMLKAMGFTRRQLASAIAWQSSVVVGIGTAIGVPIGIAAGVTLWNLFAQQIDAVPSPAVPVGLVALVVIGALVFANVVAAVPGLMAARTSTAPLLRAE